MTETPATVPATVPRVTTARYKHLRSVDEIPGDPLNVGIVGSEAALKRAMLAAGWFPADPLTMRSCAEIAGAVLLKWPYRDAPVSDLFLFRRKEDLAFEQPVGGSPAHRHHVRFWVVPAGMRTALGDEGCLPFWLGSATYDESWGLDYKERMTHHIASNVDKERDFLIGTLAVGDKRDVDEPDAPLLARSYILADFHPPGTRWGLNGGGDEWHDGDGKLVVGVLA